MNRVVVGQAAAGLAAYLLDQGLAGGPVIIGFDARHNSDVFAPDTAEIMAGAGFQALLTAGPLPTPVLAFGIGHFGCVAGVVVTASHNPPQDNGYKVYLGDGSQIVPPADARDRRPGSRRSPAPRLADVPRVGRLRVLGDELVEAYLARAASLVPAEAPARPQLGLHPAARRRRRPGRPGRGARPDSRRRGGGRAGRARSRTSRPSAFPNPEEPGAIDLALALAQQTGADLVVANDPDADRCAVAAPIDGAWRMLRGDELGALLGDDALRRGVEGTYACSIVSSSLLAAMAAAHGQPFATP